MGIFPPDFKDFLKLLDSKRVEYLLVGGWAVGYYGYVRATADMDIWISAHPLNADKIMDALREFGMPIKELPKDVFLKENNIVRMGAPPLRIEIFTNISGSKFDDCYAARKIDVIDGVSVNIISLAHLRANKKAAARLKDLNDLENL